MSEPAHIQTVTGDYYDFYDPSPECIRITDVARALSNTCRFGGHISHGSGYYSVAEHSVLVANILEAWGSANPIGGLLHDAAEAYLGDIPRPFKAPLGTVYEDATVAGDTAICFALGVDPHCLHTCLVDRADKCALRYEGQQLKAHWDHPGDPLPTDALRWPIGLLPREAERLFLKSAVRLGVGLEIPYAPPLPEQLSLFDAA